MNKFNSQLPELLAPAGSLESLCSAIYSGCDAVYLGGKQFNARQNAANFNIDELREAARLCRLFNVKLYITLNTLIYDREIKDLLAYTDSLVNEISPNAVIVQDMGVTVLLHNRYPDLPLHASTQMRLHSADAIDIMKNIGITRIIAAREMNIEDLSGAVKSGMEIEMFIHGAICVSQSGGCLMSSMIGKRSGNRGECAQPCRLPYKCENPYPLSLKDLCLAKHIPELIDTGIKSFKIEGRMKEPGYVAGVVSIYRKLIDGKRVATENEVKFLDTLFSRQGFTDGYIIAKPGKGMFGYRTENDKKQTQSIRKNVDYVNLLKDKAKNEEPAKKPDYIINNSEISSVEYIKPQNYTIFRFEGRIPDKITLPDNLKYIDISLWKINKITTFIKNAAAIRVLMPNVCTESDKSAVKKLLLSVKAEGINDVVITNLSQIPLCMEFEFKLHGDFTLNAVNEYTLKFYSDKLSSIILSPELTFSALRYMRKPLLCEAVVYGRLPLMHTENCIIESMSKTVCNKNKTDCRVFLTDRTGAKFLLQREFKHRNNLYNSVPLYLIDKQKELKQCGISGQVFIFTDEDGKLINNIVMNYKSQTPPKPPFTRGYFGKS
ncbi:MAG: hypothetical protein A2Y17_13640 [Clostridiales bacterium GWF2_38_85]|nr:MAG: hypothetical protein A2Y17_13640 [Clostridiales bacterium GWF2_38_85]